jgi:hypothetical protein
MIVALVLSGCALPRGREPAKDITVDLPVTRPEAVRRTLAAFRDQGYEVRESLTSGTNPETEPFRQHDEADVVFRAAITGSGKTSRVVFSGTYRKRRLGGLMHGDEQPVRDSEDPLERELWARLSNIALMLRRGDPGVGVSPSQPSRANARFAAHTIGTPIRNMCTSTPVTHTGVGGVGRGPMRESGTTT